MLRRYLFAFVTGVLVSAAGSSYAADLQDAWNRARVAHPGIAPIGSTDEHVAAPVGFCRTYLFVREVSVGGVIDAIRRGRTVACDGQGHVTGESALAAAVQQACRQAAEPVTVTITERAGAILLWLGLLGLAFLGFP